MTDKKWRLRSLIIGLTVMLLVLPILIPSFHILVDAASKKTDSEMASYYIGSPDELPYSDTRAGKLCKLYQEAMENKNDWIKIDVEGTINKKYKKSVNGFYSYYGELKGSTPNGNGIIFKDGSYYGLYPSYMGHFKDGKIDGYGILFNMDHERDCPHVIYEGEFNNGKYDGSGIEYYGYEYVIGNSTQQLVSTIGGNTLYSEEDYAHDMEIARRTGTVTVVMYGEKYKGKFKKDKRSGKGTEFYASPIGAVQYEGGWKNGFYDGKGEEYFSNGQLKYKGSFKRGRFDGKGTLYDESGNVIHKGQFKKGDVK